jgi:hypothetical protein
MVLDYKWVRSTQTGRQPLSQEGLRDAAMFVHQQVPLKQEQSIQGSPWYYKLPNFDTSFHCG